MEWLSVAELPIRLPGTRRVDGLARRDRTTQVLDDYVEYGREMERDVRLFAPRWIAWLYRWLPTRISWARGKAFDRASDPAYFLWSIYATRWFVGWLPARRAKRYGCWLGVLRINDRAIRL